MRRDESGSVMEFKMRKRGSALIAAALTLSLVQIVGARAAWPTSGMLVPGALVTWSGGPLNGHAPQSYVLGQDACLQACDDFLLDVELGSAPDAAHVRTMNIQRI